MNEPNVISVIFNVVRWLLFLPMAFMLGFMLPAIPYMYIEEAGITDLYAFLLTGILYAPSYMVVALFIAPRLNLFAKWSAIVLLVFIGVINILGTYIKGEMELGFFGIALVTFAVIFSFIPIQKWSWLKKYKQ